VQIKPKKGQDTREATPEWRKRLVRGEISAGEQRDLFAPMGLESVFKPPTPGSGAGQQDSIPFTRQDDQLWEFTDATGETGENKSAPEDFDAEYSGTGLESPMGTVNRSPRIQRPDTNFTQEGYSQGEDTGLRTASGLEDLRNEGITPITFTGPNTLEGGAASEVIKSALKQVTNKLESLSIDPDNRPDSPASDSFLFYNHSEPRLDGSPRDDSLLDVTSHSLPQDLSIGTVDSPLRPSIPTADDLQLLQTPKFAALPSSVAHRPTDRPVCRALLPLTFVLQRPEMLHRKRPPCLPRAAPSNYLVNTIHSPTIGFCDA
jgi:hypothetical protein